MVHSQKSSVIVKVWILSIFLLLGNVFTITAQNQNCADVDFSYEVIGNTVRLSGQSTDNILQWYWNFGNGTTVSGQHASVSFDKKLLKLWFHCIGLQVLLNWSRRIDKILGIYLKIRSWGEK